MSNSRILALVVVIGLVAGLLPYVIRHAPAWIASIGESPTTPSIQAPPASAPAATPSRSRGAKPNAARGNVPEPAATTTTATDVAETGAESSRGPAAAASGAAGRGGGSAPAARAPSNLFLPANAGTWTRLDVSIDAPTRIRTGGEMTVGPTVMGASGYHAVVRQEDLVLPSAPYMSVIGRVCSATGCSRPFAVGAGALVCPSQIGAAGALELWTNNFRGARVAESRSVYSQASGGFYIHTSPAAPEACGTGATATADTPALAEGTTLTRPEFVVSSRQGAWKPFFVPLGGALRVQATGEVRPSGGLAPTGPEGIAVTDPVWWSYPGTSSVIVDAAHPLYVSGVPYQALIGRVCGTSRCGAPFFVGRDRVVCAAADLQDRLELWINNTIAPRGLLEHTMPLSLHVFDLQARRGDYRFSLTGAPRSACGNAPAGAR